MLAVLLCLLDMSIGHDGSASPNELFCICERFDFRASQRVQDSLRATEQSLDGCGRVLLRASGTEPVVRVMVEGEPRERVAGLAEALAATIRSEAEHR